MKQQISSQTSSPRGTKPQDAEEKEAESLRKGRGQDVKKARGLGEKAGESPHEAGTDQRVKDAKKSDHSRRSH